MHSDRKISKEDTWKPTELRRHMRDSEHVDNSVRKRGDHEKKHQSTERRHRDIEHDVKKEGENTRGRRDEDGGNTGRRKESSQDRRRDKESDRQKRMEKYETENKCDDYRENKDRRGRDREEQHRDREKETHRDSKKESDRDSKKESDRRDDREKRKERHRERDKIEREHRHEKERRRHEQSGEGITDEAGKYHREQRDPHRERERHRNEEERRDGGQRRHEDRKDSERRQQTEYSDERKHKEERERRHKERSHHDERQRHSNEQQGLKGSGDEVRHHRDDTERRDKERRHRDEKDTERKNKERRGKEEEEAERKHRHRKQGEEDDAQRKHHERKHKEEEVVERKREDETDVKQNVMEAERANDEESAEQEYEDDFEDYEDDFEDMDEEEEEEELHPVKDEKKEEISPQRRKEIEAVQRAIEEENERVGTAQIRKSRNREEEEETHKSSTGSELNQRKTSQKGRFMDFVAAKKREVNKQVASKQKKRSTELLRLIDLDFSLTFSLLELQPVNEYDMYIRNFGTANTKQAYVQCNEDNADRDVQTEEIETCDKWTQHPAEQNKACGDPNISHEDQDTARDTINFDSKRLTSFLRSASQVMVVLLEEDGAERNSLRKLKTHTDTLSFSDGSSQLNTNVPFLHGRHISLVHFSQVQRHIMMSVHMPMSKTGAAFLDSCTVICIWNIWEPSRPQKILVYESEVQCCCFSPGKARLVFAGTCVGSVVLWDLREHTSDHYCSIIEGEEWSFRQPTFSTDAVLASSGHSSCVTSVEVLPSSVFGGQRLEVPLVSSEEDSSGLSFQLASLDGNGLLNFWVVVELSRGNEAGSLTDLGLRPGGKVKLLHSARLQTTERQSARDAVKTGPIHTLLFQFLPTDGSHFFIGTNMGVVHHRTSHGLKARPKSYRFKEVEMRPVDVTSLHFSPFKPHLFLVGCGDGSVRIHTVEREQPVSEWSSSTAGEAVVSLQWTNTRPSVFCVLDAASNIHIWDLSKNDAEPVLTERVHTDRVTAMAVFGDSSSQTYSGIALAHASGKIVLQYFTGNLSVSSPADEEKLESLMTEAF